MSDTVLTALIAALGAAVIPAVLSVVSLILNNRHTIMLAQINAGQIKTDAAVAAQAEHVKEVRAETFAQTEIVKQTQATVAEAKVAIEAVEKQTNSMKDALVKVTGEAEFAKGLKEGQGESATPSAPVVAATITVPKQTLKVKPHE